MAHIFHVMSTITGQINILSDYYNNPSKSSIRKSPSIPEFVYASIDRYISRHEEIIYDSYHGTPYSGCHGSAALDKE